MFAVIRNFLGIVLAVSLIGCGVAGTTFVRPEPEFLKNGATTYSEVAERFGVPYQGGSILKNGRAIKFAIYSYSALLAGHRANPLSMRLLMLFFLDDNLVGHAFVSSWADDHTDFDETKIPQIVKDHSVRSQVVALLGPPSGYYRYPLIKERRGEAAVYAYWEGDVSLTGTYSYEKELRVILDENDVVTDVEFESVSRAERN